AMSRRSPWPGRRRRWRRCGPTPPPASATCRCGSTPARSRGSTPSPRSSRRCGVRGGS
ncbi:MAG: hypothetical protein AVDCRST_MAG88-3672, partial [uncultured Thermomicrobiales bacterium]